MHVSILFSLVYLLCGKKRVLTALIGIPVLILFAAVAGFTPSIVRACIMQSLMILALLLKREYDPPTALGFSVLVTEGILLKAYICDGQTHQDRTKMPGCSLSEMMLKLILKE